VASRLAELVHAFETAARRTYAHPFRCSLMTFSTPLDDETLASLKARKRNQNGYPKDPEDDWRDGADGKADADARYVHPFVSFYFISLML